MTSPTAPRVTIGVPVYNGERYLGACLESLLAQTFTDLAVIVCDNASTDGTAEIAGAYARRDRRVRYHRNERNIGCPRNFTRVFELASTPFFRWASADDLSAPTYVERCMDVLDAHPEVVQAYPGTLLIDADGNPISGYDDNIHAVDARPSDRYIAVTRDLRLCNAIYGVVRSDVLRRTGVLASYIGSDLVLQAELALYGGIWQVKEPLFLRRMHANAQSAMSDEERTRHYHAAAATGARRSSQWRHLWERTRGVMRSSIAPQEKARILRFLARTAVMSRDEFGRELGVVVRRTAHVEWTRGPGRRLGETS